VIDTVAARFPGRHIVLLGDLSSREGGDTMNFLLQQGELLGRVSPVQFFDTWTLAGGNRASSVGTGIDWVLTTDGTGQFIGVQDATVVANVSQASDHTPITATLF
jgi:endonuclease/exonuclease/phosphatase family metal-dependent hydrolase